MTLRTRSANIGGAVITATGITLSTGTDLSTQANDAYFQANTARDTANDAYSQANTANTNALTAYGQANLAYEAANNSNLKLGGLVTGTINVTQDLIVGGNIYLEGNTTYINVSTYSVQDSLIYLASNNELTDSVDIGFMGGKNTSGTYSHTGLARDATDGKWKLFDGLPEEGHVGNVVNFANTYLATLVANVEANSITVLGNRVAVNTDVAAAYAQANAAREQANTARSDANTTFATMNSTFGTVNTNITNTFTVSFTSNINASTDRNPGSYGSYASSATNTPTNSGILLNLLSGSGGTGDGWQLWTDYNINGNLYTRRRWGGTYSSWAQIWSAANDGAGSGLDADLWDGYQFADYLNQAVKTTSTPTFTGLTVSNTITGSISGNAGTVSNGMYLNAGQTSTVRKAFAGSQNVGSLQNATGSLGGLELYGGGSTNAAFMCFHRPGAYASYFGIDNDNQFAVGGWSAGGALANFKCNSLGVGTAASGTAGEIRATNNVTAYYSDARLKKFLGKINNALDKVSQLNGYYYVENEVAEQYGYNNKEEQVGVSAQEVEAVLPHIVTRAPFDIAKAEDGTEYSKSGEDYKTVRYERLVPLLIEAIKELKSEIEELKKR